MNWRHKIFRNFIATTASAVMYILIAAGFIFLLPLVVRMAVWLCERIFPILQIISGWTLLIYLLLLIPMAIFRPTRSVAALSMFLATLIFGITTVAGGLLISHDIWGFLGCAIGMGFWLIGVIPVAILASLIHGLWWNFTWLLLMVFFTVGSGLLVLFVVGKEHS